MKPFLIAGNWKMYKSNDQALALARQIKMKATAFSHTDILICPPCTALTAVADVLGDSRVQLGAQNMHWKSEGAFTGEVSGQMVLSTGAAWVLLGHSERRQIFRETGEEINLKLKAALELGLKPVLCIGETLEQRESGQMLQVLEQQLEEALPGISSEQLALVTVAYEPVWAIGTGKVATPEQAQESHKIVRNILRSRFDEEVVQNLRILYGGSVKADNAESLLELPDVNGALIGGASLDAEGFATIIGIAERIGQ